jgi:hypothetical protein
MYVLLHGARGTELAPPFLNFLFTYLFSINIYKVNTYTLYTLRVDTCKLLLEYGHEQVKLRKKKCNNKEFVY